MASRFLVQQGLDVKLNMLTTTKGYYCDKVFLAVFIFEFWQKWTILYPWGSFLRKQLGLVMHKMSQPFYEFHIIKQEKFTTCQNSDIKIDKKPLFWHEAAKMKWSNNIKASKLNMICGLSMTRSHPTKITKWPHILVIPLVGSPKPRTKSKK